MHPSVERVQVSESLAMAEIASDFYSDDPMFEFLLGKKNGAPQRRLALKNCIVTSDFCQTVYSSRSRKAFVHVVDPDSWDSALHEFILRGTMKIPFVIDSGTIERMSEYRDACRSRVAGRRLHHVAAAYCEKGHEQEVASILGEVVENLGRCYSVAHTERQARFLLDSGFEVKEEFDLHGVICRLMLRAG